MSLLPKLPSRLALAAEMAGSGRCIADIGTDHALLPAFLLLENRFETALLCDIVPGPLQRAEECVRRCDLLSRCELRLTAGFDGLNGEAFDTAAICGMGGLNIIEILSAAAPILTDRHRLVLQPQTDILAVRAFLFDCGYTLESEQAVCEERRCYTVLSVRPPVQPIRAEVSVYTRFDPRFAQHQAIWRGGLHPQTRAEDAAYIEHCLRLYRPMTEGARISGSRKITAALETLIENFTHELRTEDAK